MIHVLTGPVGSGKTTALGKIIRSWRSRDVGFDGFLSLRVTEAEETLGYDLFELKGEKGQPLLRRTGRPEWPRVGDFYFIPEGLSRAKEIIGLSSAGDILVVDEIGPIELEGGGLWPPLSQILLDDRRRFLVVIRDSALVDFLPIFRPARVEVVSVGDPEGLTRIQGEPGRISVKFKFFAYFREVFAAKEKTLACQSGCRLGEILNRICDSPERGDEIFDSGRLKPHLVIMINGIPLSPLTGLEAELRDGDVVSLFPLMGGG